MTKHLNLDPISLVLGLRATFEPAVVDLTRPVTETGQGTPGANLYCSLEEAKTYFIGRRLYSSAWSTSSPERQVSALMQATAILDAEFTWSGTKPVNANQGLAWPFTDAQDRYYNTVVGIPKALKDATCEVAFSLLVATEDPLAQQRPGVGLKQLKVDVITLVFDKADAMSVIPPLVPRILYGLGFLVRSGTIRNIKLIRG